MKDYFSKDFIDLLHGLLEKDVKKRFNIDDVLCHPFFKKVDWDKIQLKQGLKPPLKPNLKKNLNVSKKE
jgi:serine/threonine protein kinase